MAASTSGKNRNKIETIDEQSVCIILQRYTADTLLILLQEIANYPENKINWNDIAIKTNNRVSIPSSLGPTAYSPKELKNVWRHLAYRKPLIKLRGGNRDDIKVDNGSGDDDDSDLEIELEVYPPLGLDDGPILKEAVNCVTKFASRLIVESNGKKIKDKNLQK